MVRRDFCQGWKDLAYGFKGLDPWLGFGVDDDKKKAMAFGFTHLILGTKSL